MVWLSSHKRIIDRVKDVEGLPTIEYQSVMSVPMVLVPNINLLAYNFYGKTKQKCLNDFSLEPVSLNTKKTYPSVLYPSFGCKDSCNDWNDSVGILLAAYKVFLLI